jgi:hypothetical protein
VLAIIDPVLEHLPRFPFSLDPLIAEAKRRMRKRRLMVAVLAVAVAGGAAGAALALVSSTSVSQGTAVASPGIAAKSCPFYPVQHALQSCHSRGSDWVLSIRYDRSSSVCKLRFSRGDSRSPVWTYRSGGGCLEGQSIWVKPHLLIFPSDYPLVNGLDPSTHRVTLLGQLSDFLVSPNGEWIAGTGPGDPKVDPEATTVYVLSVHARMCLVVPGVSGDIAGFTPDSENVIVRRAYQHGSWQLRQFALSSLRSACPTGPNGVLPQKS